MYTELDAVNFLLSHVGAAPVASLANPLPDVSSAQLRLNEGSMWVQKQGWWFNRLLSQTLTPVADEIALPSNTLKVISPYPAFYIERDSKLYSPLTDSYEFTADVCLDIILFLTWDQLPPSAQDAIMYRAAKNMILHELEDHHKAALVEKDANISYVELKKEDLQIKQRRHYSLPAVQKFLSKVRPYTRGGSYDPVYPGGGT